jgi:hypothetical protein
MTGQERLQRGLALLGETQILPLVSRLSPDYVEYLLVSDFLKNSDTLLNLLKNLSSMELKTLMENSNSIKPMPHLLYHLALIRQNWITDQVYLDQPNILTYHKGLQINEKGELSKCEGFDIVANSIGISVIENTQKNPFLIRLKQGIIDTNVEAILSIFNYLRRGIDPTVGRGVSNTAELFDLSRRQGIQWITLQNPDDPLWSGIKIDKDVRARIKKDLKAGYKVVVPAKAIPSRNQSNINWWRIDPQTGQTLGIGKRGWGQTATEWVQVIGKIVVMNVSVVLSFISCFPFENIDRGSASSTVKSLWNNRNAARLCYLCALMDQILAGLVYGAVIRASNIVGWWRLISDEVAISKTYLSGAVGSTLGKWLCQGIDAYL